jgi:2-hydroxychromene-2-carboxylate isomerase
MAEPVEFFFDFSSPYAYFSSFKIDELAGRFDRKVVWRPYLMGAALKLTGRATPLATGEPASLPRDYLRHDCERTARLDSRPFVWPDPFPVSSLYAARLYYWLEAEQPAQARELAAGMFHAVFGEGRDIGDRNEAISVAVALGLDSERARAALDDVAIKARLKDVTEDAVTRGVFGSPVIAIDGEMFWGNDRLWMVKRWLDWGGW